MGTTRAQGPDPYATFGDGGDGEPGGESNLRHFPTSDRELGEELKLSGLLGRSEEYETNERKDESLRRGDWSHTLEDVRKSTRQIRDELAKSEGWPQNPELPIPAGELGPRQPTGNQGPGDETPTGSPSSFGML